jgi:hypothetical protein
MARLPFTRSWNCASRTARSDLGGGVASLTTGGGGGGSDAYYRHVQSVAAAVWTVVHNLGKFPSVSVVDSTGTTSMAMFIMIVPVR